MAPAIKLFGDGPEGDELQRLYDADREHAAARRRAREGFKNVQFTIDHILFKTPSDGVKTKESYKVNSRGIEIFSKSWLPESSPPKAIVCFCHGYGDTCSFFFEGTAKRLALAGYGVFAMDYPGFGLSEGLHGYIPNFDNLVEDVIEHFTNVKAEPEFSSLPSFLMGESMGGAVVLKIHLKQPNAWSGAILLAPMCKIADDATPPPLITKFFVAIAKIIPKKKLVPQKSLVDLAFRDLKKRALVRYNVVGYKSKPRLGTAYQLLKTTKEIEKSLEKVSLPMLILHGDADSVTDPSASKELYEKARSKDKKINMYEDAYHALLEGEPDDTVLRVMSDIISWLDQRSSSPSSSNALVESGHADIN